MTPSAIVGIDPGLSSGGLVALCPRSERVLAAHSLLGPGVPSRSATAGEPEILGDRNFTLAERLAAAQAARTLAALDAVASGYRIVRIGVESFVDQRSRAREDQGRLIKDRWKTPLVIGHLCAGLAARGFTSVAGNLVFQDAGIVIRHFASELRELAGRPRGDARDRVAADDHLLTNDHLRKAWAHALWLSLRT